MADKRIYLHLKRGTKGLGFNIIGGTDIPQKNGDCGIFVSKIKKGGAAEVDGTLQVGDRIIEVNTVNLENVSHHEAVETFLKTGDEVSLVIERRNSEDSTDHGKSYFRVLKFALPVVLIGAAIVTSVVVARKKNLI